MCMPSTACPDLRLQVPLLSYRLDHRSLQSQVSRNVVLIRSTRPKLAGRRLLGPVCAKGSGDSKGNPFITNKGSDADDQ